MVAQLSPGEKSRRTMSLWPNATRALATLTSGQLARDKLIKFTLADDQRTTALIAVASGGVGIAMMLWAAAQAVGDLTWWELVLGALALTGLYGALEGLRVLVRKQRQLTASGRRALTEVASVQLLVDKILDGAPTTPQQLVRLLPWAVLFGKGDAWVDRIVESGVQLEWLDGEHDTLRTWNRFSEAAVREATADN